MSGALWPYLVVVLAGFLPNEVFRIAGVLLARGVDERSEIFGWIRVVAVTLLAGVVSKLLFSPAAALATVPLPIRLAAVGIGVACFFVAGRRLLLAILVGECAFVLAAAWAGA